VKQFILYETYLNHGTDILTIANKEHTMHADVSWTLHNMSITPRSRHLRLYV